MILPDRRLLVGTKTLVMSGKTAIAGLENATEMAVNGGNILICKPKVRRIFEDVGAIQLVLPSELNIKHQSPYLNGLATRSTFWCLRI